VSVDRRLRALFFLGSAFSSVNWFLRGALAGLTLALVGCASGTNLLSDVVAGVVADRFDSGADPTRDVKLNPDYRYLRVEVDGRPPALLVLGYVDADPDGPIETWYSAGREVIKTQNGRIVATVGLETDWRSVRFQPRSPPAWTPHAGGQPTFFDRLRDEKPGYRYSVQDQIEHRAWDRAPPGGVSPALAAAGMAHLVWFRENTVRSTGDVLPPAWFAIDARNDSAIVVYSEQCLTPVFCLKLLRWPLQGRAG